MAQSHCAIWPTATELVVNELSLDRPGSAQELKATADDCAKRPRMKKKVDTGSFKDDKRVKQKSVARRSRRLQLADSFTHFYGGQHHFRIFIERQDLFRLTATVLRWLALNIERRQR
jgi:hypothetical protein